MPLKRTIFYCITLCILTFPSLAQKKPIIDTGSLRWPYILGDAKINKYGEHAAYTIRNLPIGKVTLVIQSLNTNKSTQIVRNFIEEDFFFSEDGEKLIWLDENGLFFISINTGKISCFTASRPIDMAASASRKWLVFIGAEQKNNVTLVNLVDNKRKQFNNVNSFKLDDNGHFLLLRLSGSPSALNLVNLQNSESFEVWSGSVGDSVHGFKFDKSGHQLAFIVSREATTEVLYYSVGMKKARKRVFNESKLLHNKFKIFNIVDFNINGNWLFIQLTRDEPLKRVSKIDSELARVDLWSYRDLRLNPEQRTGQESETVDMVVSTNDTLEGVILNADGLKNLYPNEITSDYTILTSDTVNRPFWWPHLGKPSDWIVSLKDGSRKILLRERDKILFRTFSPKGRFVTWWEESTGAWWSYEIAAETIRNVSYNVPSTFVRNPEYLASTINHPVAPIPFWFPDDSAMLVYDNFDIWKLDPSCTRPALNITQAYGANNRVQLRLVTAKFKGEDSIELLDAKSALLTGFNIHNKQNGFYSLTLNETSKPEPLINGPFIFFEQGGWTYHTGMKPMRGGTDRKKVWLVMRQSATECPNYFSTKDFKYFRNLTSLKPQQGYNWMTSELISWTLPDGRQSQGVLYKPENFDSTVTYPVIFNYYEKFSGRLNEFRFPGLTYSNINVAWFVSRGYLVFTPDIYYDNGSMTGISSGRYAFNAIESAAEKLCERKYVDRGALAIQGHSFGGMETNYILTHSKRFAAAASNAGFTDIMSSYLTLVGQTINVVDRISTQEHKETGHEFYGGTPWEQNQLYIDNSAVWSAHNASAPLLMFHNKKDEQVQWRQGVEMYMALRRLAKPCWMLQYDDSGHGLSTQNDALDYTIRVTQFFDHYLRREHPPRWMVEGIPANLKQVENRYELSTSGSCHIDCEVCRGVAD